MVSSSLVIVEKALQNWGFRIFLVGNAKNPKTLAIYSRNYQS